MGNYGSKISKAGFGITDGDNDLILNTKYPLLKIKHSGTGTITLSGGSATKTVVTHSLNYKPMFYLWVTYIDSSTGSEVAKHRMCSWTEYLGLQVYDYYLASATTTTITLNVDTSNTLSIVGGSGTDTLEYVYVVYYDPIS